MLHYRLKPLEKTSVRIGLGIQQHTFQAANAKKSRVTRRVLYPWKPPSIGWLKANVDRAFNNTSNNGGLGVVIRDSDGVLVGGGCVFVMHVHNSLMVEVLAVRLACQVAVQFHLSHIIFESDCLKIVYDIKDGKEDNSGYGIVLDDVRQLLAALPGSGTRIDFLVVSSLHRHVYGESNTLAQGCKVSSRFSVECLLVWGYPRLY
ncbi:hypothetical protein ACLB2K_073299 [Fragaria x ananassa]